MNFLKNLPRTLGYTTSSSSAALLHLLPLFCVSDHDITCSIWFVQGINYVDLAVVPGGWRLQCHTHFTMRDSTYTHWCPTPYQPPRKTSPHGYGPVSPGYKVPGELATFSPALNPLPWPSHLILLPPSTPQHVVCAASASSPPPSLNTSACGVCCLILLPPSNLFVLCVYQWLCGVSIL